MSKFSDGFAPRYRDVPPSLKSFFAQIQAEMERSRVAGKLVWEPDDERILVGDATAPLTGVGVFLGLDDPDYEFRAGDPGGDHIHWDGSTLSITGSLTVGSSVPWSGVTDDDGNKPFDNADVTSDNAQDLSWLIATGIITAGNLDLDATNEQIRIGSASAPLTGAGVFLGKDGADYEFRVGDPAGEYIHWDGSNLSVVGSIIGTSNIVDSAITTAKINALAVTASELATDAVTNAKVAAGAIDTAELANLAVEAAKLGDLSVTSAKIASGAVIESKVGDAAITTIKLDNAAVTEVKIGSSAVTSVKLASGAVTEAKIGTSAVTSTKIGSGAVVEAKIGDLAVTTVKLADGSITKVKFSTDLTPTEKVTALPALPDSNYPEGIVVYLTGDSKLYRSTGSTWTKAVDGADLEADTVTANAIVAGTITAAEIAADTITANEIAADTITASQIASATITASEIATDTLTANEIAANTITGTEILTMNISGKTATFDTGSVGGWTMSGGDLSSGSVKLESSSERILLGSATAPLTGVGVFLGLDGTDYEFRTGDPAGQYIHWDGATLNVVGEVIGTSNLVDAAVTEAKIGTDAVTTAKIQALAVTSSELATDAVTNAKIAAAAVDTAELANLSISTAKLQALAVDSAKLADDAVVESKIFNAAVTEAKLDTAAVTTTKIGSLAVTTAKIAAGAVTTTEVGDAAITTAKMDDSSVTEVKLGDASVSSLKLQTGSVIEAKIGSSAVTTTKLGTGAVTEAKIGSSAVTTAKVASGAITTAEIGSLAVTTAKMADGSVSTVKIVDGAVVGAKVGAKEIRMQHRFVGSHDNLVMNPGFEQSTTILEGWSKVDGGATGWSATTSNVRTGGVAALYDPTGQTADGRLISSEEWAPSTDGVAVAEGDEVYFEFWVRKVSTGTPNTVFARLLFRDRDGTHIDSTTSSTVIPTQTYQKVSVSGTVSAGTAVQVFADIVVNNEGNSEQIVVDDVFMRRKVVGDFIVDGTITATHIAAGTITASEIAAGTITATEIAAGTITSNEIASDTIVAGNIAAATITAAEIASGTITANEIAAGTITANEIATDTITANELAANSVTASEINVATLSAITADMGTLTAGKVDVGSIEINADTERILFGAATAPLTGVGVFLGKDSTDYEFRAGDPGGQFIHWDGSELLVGGVITASEFRSDTIQLGTKESPADDDMRFSIDAGVNAQVQLFTEFWDNAESSWFTGGYQATYGKTNVEVFFLEDTGGGGTTIHNIYDFGTDGFTFDTDVDTINDIAVTGDGILSAGGIDMEVDAVLDYMRRSIV